MSEVTQIRAGRAWVNLDQPSTVYRSSVARGITKKDDDPIIDRDGGNYQAGIIRKFSVITIGEALGHDMWIDEEFLAQVNTAINAQKNGVKSRFTHPDMSGDGLGKMAAKTMDSEVDGDRVIADNHFLKSAHNTPDGDLAGYILSLADESPEDFGASIAFYRDRGEEMKFMAMHSDKDGVFKSPDKRNKNNYRHARLAELEAVDIVDEPAANPGGLFHRGPFKLLENGNAILDYAFGVTDQPPETHFGIDPSRIRGFVAKWAAEREIEINTKGQKMPDPAVVQTSTNAENADAVELSQTVATNGVPAGTVTFSTVDPEIPADKSAETFTAEQLADREKAAADRAREELLAKQKDFIAKFGAENGAKWFAEGISLEEAKDRHIAALSDSNKSLNERLSAAEGGLGEETALSGTPNSKPELPSKYLLNCGKNLGTVAAAIDAQATRLGLIKPSVN